jgi:excisionase family DNA binding protein
MTLAEVAVELGVTPDYVRNMIHRGLIPGEKVGPRMWMVEPADVEKYKLNRRPKGQPKKEKP